MTCCVCYETIVPGEDHFTCDMCREGILCGLCTKKHLTLCWNQKQSGSCPICKKAFPIFYHGTYFSGEVVLSCSLLSYPNDDVSREYRVVINCCILFGGYLSFVCLVVTVLPYMVGLFFWYIVIIPVVVSDVLGM